MSFSPDFNWVTFRHSGFRMSRNVEELGSMLSNRGQSRAKSIRESNHRRLISEDLRDAKGAGKYVVSFRNEVRKALINLKKSPIKLNKIELNFKKDPRQGNLLEKELNDEEMQVKRFIDAIVSNDPSPYKKTGFTSEKQAVDISSADKLIKEAKKIVQHGVRKKYQNKGLNCKIEFFWYTYICKDPVTRWDIFEDNYLAYIKNYMNTDLGILSRLNWQKFIIKLFQQISKDTYNSFIWIPSPAYKILPKLQQKTISLQDFSKLIQTKDLIFLMFSCIDENPSAPIQKQNDQIYTYACGCKYKGQWCERIREGVGLLEMCSKETYSGIFVNGKFQDFGYLTSPSFQYKGFFKKGFPNGFGSMVFPDTSKFEGIFEKGNFINGNLYFADGSFYQGEILNSEIEGRGELRRVDGSVCKGMWHFGKLNGEGEIRTEENVVKGVFIEGELVSGVLKCQDFRYEGEFKGLVPEGIGEFRYKSGGKYSGSVVAGGFEGLGTLWYSDGTVYEGNFEANHPEGLGKLSYPCGKVFTGEFVNGVPNGQGQYLNFNSRVSKYEGQVVDGALEGQGKAHLSNGSLYQGEFFNNSGKGKGRFELNSLTLEGDFLDFYLHGSGELKLGNCSYCGSWNWGLPEGQGEAKDSEGNTYSGTFNKGHPSGKHKLSPEFLKTLLSLTNT